jgi:hypothetical protein
MIIGRFRSESEKQCPPEKGVAERAKKAVSASRDKRHTERWRYDDDENAHDN